MPILLLIRHAENNYIKLNRLPGRLPGVHLNRRGKAQARLLAERLKAAPIKAVYSSPLERAMETALPLAKALGLEVISRPGLIETDIGEWQGASIKKLGKQKYWRVVQQTPSLAHFPGGESFLDGQLRICQEISALGALHEKEDLLVAVSHGDPIKLAVAYYLGMPLDLFQRLSVSPAAITALMLGDGFVRVLTLNYDPSLTFSKP